MKWRLISFLTYGAALAGLQGTGLFSGSLGRTAAGAEVLPLVTYATLCTLVLSVAIATGATILGSLFGCFLRFSQSGICTFLVSEVVATFEILGPLLPSIAFVILFPRMPMPVVTLVVSAFCSSSVALQVRTDLNLIQRRSYILAGRGFGLPMSDMLISHYWPEIRMGLTLIWRRLFAESLVLSGALGFWGVASFRWTLGYSLWDSATILRTNPAYFTSALVSTLTLFVVIGHVVTTPHSLAERANSERECQQLNRSHD
jgi:ABC-type dipeptide/oligopeptide/nickel transport system permease subunit